MEFENVKLNKKDEKKINKLLRYFRNGLITGSSIIVGFLLALLIIEFIK